MPTLFRFKPQLRASLFVLLVWFVVGCAPPPQAGGAEMSTGNFLFSSFYFFALIYFGYYFMVMRPQMLREKDQKAFLEGLKKGDDVVSTGGIYGKVVSVEGEAVIVEVDRNVKLRFRASNLSSARQEEKKGEGK